MDIDDIKPPGGYGPFVDPAAETPVEPKRESSFAEAKDKLQASRLAEPMGSTLAAASQFSKTALQDPAKLDVMVRACVSELIDSGQSVTGPLSGVEKQSLQEFLSGDPLVREQIESYLRKVLV
jgi:hypothetical protein